MVNLKQTVSEMQTNKGSALVLVLVIVTAVTILCSMVLVGIYLQMKFIRRDINQIQAHYLAEAGVYKTVWYLSGNGNQNVFWRPENEVLTLFEDDTVRISVDVWGGYLLVHSNVEHKGAIKNLSTLVGEVSPEPFEQAIVIGKLDYPLVVTGKNRIIGDVTVNSDGVKTGVDLGERFEGDQLVEGKINRKQNLEMPYFNPVLFDQACEEYENIVEDTIDTKKAGTEILTKKDLLNMAKDGIVQIQGNVVIEDSIKYASLSNLRRIICSDSLTIRGETILEGFMEIIVGKMLTVQDHVYINHCILYAHQGINISDSCWIQAQLLSSGDIIVSGTAIIKYPSIIYSQGYVIHNAIQGRIAIQDQAVMMGTIILQPDTEIMKEKDDQTFIEIGKQTKLVGIIYSSHFTTHKGVVYGSIATGGFYFYESPTHYLNNLINSITDRTKLPEIYRMPLLFSLKPRLDVIEWFDE